VLFIREAYKANRCLVRTAAFPRPGDGVADTAVSQPAGITAVIPQELPGSEYLANFRDLSAILQACLNGLIVGQLGRVN